MIGGEETTGGMMEKEELIWDEHVEEEVGNRRRVEDEAAEYQKVKQEVLIEDVHVEEEVGSDRVEDEVVGYPMIEQAGDSTAHPLGDESDAHQGSIGVQKSEAGPSMMEDGIVVKDEPMIGGEETTGGMMEDVAMKQEDVEEEVGNRRRVEDEAAEYQIIKQEVLIEDVHVEEEVGSDRVEDEVVGYPMIEQAGDSTAHPLGDESDAHQGCSEVQKSEAGPSRVIHGYSVTKLLMCTTRWYYKVDDIKDWVP
ncbi:hypothetical protein GE061_008628 [Apolygus lucorum]|uniref:Uncharacterized protein n=1 Tax=Apolygus lucorum TaxID=248454 RepID=A0A8S9WKN7_APOLU|nr:hypothetical protein GE061_008628 [Apolygus lucorum]